MNLAYTITSGYLECQNDRIDISFALVFLNNGVYSVEMILTNTEIYEKNKFHHYYKISGKTEKNYSIECSNLSIRHHSGSNNKVIFICEGFIKLTQPERREQPPYENFKREKEAIWFVELENLKTTFANFTDIKKMNRYGSELKDDFFNTILDHTETPWVIDGLQDNGNYFKFKIFKKNNSENILIDFRNSNINREYCTLYKNDYDKVKFDLISLLSFINGGIVKIRKEYTGEFYGQSNRGFSSSTEINYSFENEYSQPNNSYLQINYHHSFSSDIFRDIFLNCFSKYQYINKIIDIESLIFSINVSSQTIGLEERYFILITALERIAKKSSAHININKIVDDQKSKDYFSNEIKPNLLNALKPLKDIDEKNWERIKSIISNLDTPRKSTNKILFEFLDFSKIPLNNNVKSLIKKERNQAVHEGVIGKDSEEMFENYLKLDHILRDCILNIIGYFGPRNRRYLYATKEEHNESNPKSNTTSHSYVIM